MFGNKKEGNKASKNTPTATSSTINFLVKGTEIEGDVDAKSDIRIDGSIIGNLKCAAKVIIGAEGKVDGSIVCENAIIEGHFNGDITVSGLLSVKENAVLTGNVATNKLEVTPGAQFNGSCSMGNNAQKAIANGQARRKSATTRELNPKAAAENGKAAKLEKEAS